MNTIITNRAPESTATAAARADFETAAQALWDANTNTKGTPPERNILQSVNDMAYWKHEASIALDEYAAASQRHTLAISALKL